MVKDFVNGNLECEFYTFIFRPNQQQLRKMKLYIGPLARIEPAAKRFWCSVLINCDALNSSSCNIQIKMMMSWGGLWANIRISELRLICIFRSYPWICLDICMKFILEMDHLHYRLNFDLDKNFITA